jgi:hypothetical protein
VLDFGLARSALDRANGGGDRPISITGEFMGSLPWASPEQAQGNPDEIDLRTDVYSLGVILYQMLTGGRFPYTVVGNVRDVLNNILTAAPTPPSKAVPRPAVHKAPSTSGRKEPIVNATIERVVLKALAKDRRRRHQTAGELRRDVADYLRGRLTSTPEKPHEPRWRAAAWLSYAAAPVLLAAAAAVGYRWRPVTTATPPSHAAGALPSLAREDLGAAAPEPRAPRPVGAQTTGPVSTGAAAVGELPATNSKAISWIIPGLKEADFGGWSAFGDVPPEVEDGVLLLSGRGGWSGVVCGDATLTDYKLRLELAGSPGLRAYIVNRMVRRGDDIRGFTGSIVERDGQIFAGHTGQDMVKHEGGMGLAQMAPGEFCTVELAVRNDTLWTTVNGRKTSGVRRRVPARGQVALMVANGTLKVKRMEIVRLDASGRPRG